MPMHDAALQRLPVSGNSFRSERSHAIRALLLLISWLSPALLIAQASPLRFDHLSQRQGLSQSTVFSMLQDETGFMWIATADGLNKFDGYTFTVYRPDPADSSSISELGIRLLFRDCRGAIWVITMGGKINRYVDEQDNFRHYRLPFDSAASRPPRAIAITESPDSTLWLGATSGTLYRFSRARDHFEAVALPPAGGTIHLQSLHADAQGLLWMGTWEGLFRFDPARHTLRQFRNDPADPRSLGGNIVFDITEDRNGRIWIATANGGVSVLSLGQDQFTVYRHRPDQPGSLSSDRVMRVFADRKDRIWIGTVDAGLNRFDPRREAFDHYQHDSARPSSLASGAIISIYQDRAGALWFGTSSDGISRLDPQRQRFRHISHDSNNPASLSQNTVLAILEDRNGGLWVGTDGGGLNYRPSGSTSFRHYLKKSHKLSSNSITAVYQDREGLIWIGADPGVDRNVGTIVTYDPASGKMTPFEHAQLSIGGVVAFYQDHQGDIWIGTTTDGLRRYRKSRGETTVYKASRDDSSSLSGNSIFAITEDRAGNLWLGTVNAGLNRLDRKSGRFSRFTNTPGDTASLSNNTVWCLYADSAGQIWMGTWGGGLNRRDPRSGNFRHFTDADGLPSNVIYAILPDDSGHLWLSTNRGLCRFDPRSGPAKNYDVSDGLQGDEFNQGAAFRGKDGRLYFGGSNGISVFNPEEIRDNPHPPPVVLTRFSVFDKPLPLPEPVWRCREIVLSYKQNFFSFEFAALNYTAPEKNQYAYLLEGIDPDWVAAGSRRFASYTNIAPGDYRFRVRGSNNDGVWSREEASVYVRITPPFWQTWWFQGLMIAALAAALGALHRYRVHRLLEVERTRMRIARDLHDEVSATLTGIVYYSDAMDSEIEKQNPGGIQRLRELIYEGAREAQEAMSDIVWAINPQYDRWDVLLPRMRRYAGDLCESRGIDHDIHIPDMPAGRSLLMDQRRNLWLIFKEMVTNAVKHSGCSRLEVTIEFSGNILMIEVGDDGCGFAPDAPGSGNGLRNIRERAAALGATAELESAPEAGTRWIIRKPL